MFVPLSLLPLIFLLLPLAFSNSISKQGCLSVCGSLPIPYPFGVGSGCSLNPSFDINCNTSTNPPKPYLSIIHKEVIEINQTYVRVKYPNLVSVCYDLSDDKRGNGTILAAHESYTVNLTGTPYWLSVQNTLTVIGCDDMVMGIMQPDGGWVSGGCSAFCAEKNDAGGVGYCAFNATSVGNGCCQSSISGDVSFFGARSIDLGRKLGRRKLFPCSHAFIREENENETAFLYPLYYLDNSTALLNDNWASTTGQPVVRLDWVAGAAENCSQAKRNQSTYACKAEKSVCIDEDSDVFFLVRKGYYSCSCSQGHQGNPYLPGGCTPTSFSSSIARSNCPDQCGNVSIPFPFGVGPKCSLSPSFEILCNTITNPPKPYLRSLNAEVTQLSPSKVFVKYPKIASTCYYLSNNQSAITKTEKRSLIIDLLRTPYTFSDENWITTIGCDDMVVAVTGKDSRSSIRSSCAAICSFTENYLSTSAYCPYKTTAYFSGDGCCRTPIPRGTTYLEANLADLSGRWPLTDLYCSYAFVDYDKNDQTYSATYSFTGNPMATTPHDLLPDIYWSPKLALDWRIGTVKCKEARLDPKTFACKAHSDCIDFDATVGGYLCNCSKGYQGNPYLPAGCQDIDECADDTTNSCVSNSMCKNTNGSYYCACPTGYDGDGMRNGTGCIRSPPSKSEMIILIGVSTGVGCLLLLLVFVRMYKMYQKRKEKNIKGKFFKRNGGLLLQQQTNESTLGKIKVFPAKELEVATDNFNESRILGKGGQGTVYKGMLSDGKIVAIKKSKLVEEKHLEQFINEVAIMSQINHRNVVSLLGCCLETEVPLLVYELMPNGTLFDLLHDPNSEFTVPWNMRLKMAADIAGALAYLHSASSVPIYHRDIKSSNILLDEKYVVKLSDFGTSRSVTIDQTHLSTMVKGTFGYFDPEYFQSSQFTEKSDVYSFGVVLVELLTGKRPISNDNTDEERSLAMRFLTSMEEKSVETILDPQVLEQSRKDEVISIARLAQRCLNLKGKMRPTMKEVANELESFRISQMSSSIVRDEIEEVRAFESRNTTFSDIEYTWSSSYKNVSDSPSASHPLMFAT